MTRPRQFLAVLMLAATVSAQQPGTPPSQADDAAQQQTAGADAGQSRQPPAPPAVRGTKRTAPPPEPGESSSRDTQISLEPPAGETGPTPDEGSSVAEMSKWDPHRAAKHIEVADYYFKQKNYRAAESRYREALEWKSNDARAMWGLAESLEKLGKKEEARTYYAGYLKVLPKGSKAAEARAAIERLK